MFKRNLFAILFALVLIGNAWAQMPQNINYQAIIRDSNAELVPNTKIGMKISILQGSPEGTVVYSETHTPTTNANGLVSVDIGAGSVSWWLPRFDDIDWSAGPQFIKAETDPAGGSNYIITGTSQILSVPYALHTKTAENISGTIPETDPLFEASIAGGINATDTVNWNNKQNQLQAGRGIEISGNVISLEFPNSQEIPATPRIDFIEMLATQPHENDAATIWYDDFSTEKRYMDGYGGIDNTVNFGTKGGSMDAGFDKGDVDGNGNRKVAFGDFPGNVRKVREGEQFDDVYWRIYVKHEHGWEGSPAKMSRATSIVSTNWQQAMIAHVWSGANNSLTLDPARGVDGQTDQIKTTKYNDFDNLRWLGNKPSSDFKISSTEESGYWVLVESRAKLNTPGKSDGLNQLWIDGRLEAERKNLNFRGSYTKHGINAVFLESYWNSGSVKTQGRWFDNFVISTTPIGPVVCPANPILHKTPYYGPGGLAAWEVELSSDYNGDDVVFKSKLLGREEELEINQSTGSFLGTSAGHSALASGKTYFCRVRQKSSFGVWSNWSRWHQGFRVK